MTGTDDIRRFAMALPEVEETSHFRFHVPAWKVHGKTFLGLQAVLDRISPERARELAELAWRQRTARPAAPRFRSCWRSRPGRYLSWRRLQPPSGARADAW